MTTPDGTPRADSSLPAAEKFMKLASEYASQYEPKVHQLWNQTVNRVKTINAQRACMVLVAAIFLVPLAKWMVPWNRMPTKAHNFASAEDLESFLNSIVPNSRPTRFLLHSATPHLELTDPLRFTEAHAHHHFAFHHGAHFSPLTLSCAGTDTAITIRAPSLTLSNLIIKSCTRSAIYVHIPARHAPSATANTTTLSNLTLLSNYGDKGAAVHVARGFLILAGVNATDNYAPAGGAIYLARGSTGLRVVPPSDLVHGVRNVFQGNSANQGGAIYADRATLGLELAHVAFVDNVAFQAGGAVYSAQPTSGDASPLAVTSCNFTGNQAAQKGGALACEGNHAVTLSKSTLSDNAAGQRGGAVWLHSGNAGQLSVAATALTSNTAGSAAAAALKAPGGSSKPSSSSSSSGRKLRSPAPPRAPSASASSSKPSNGTAAPHTATDPASLGGAIFLSGSCQAAVTDGSKFARNSAGMGGGALTCVDCASVKIADSTFDRNTAASGGAAYLQLLRGPATIHKSRFTGNTARWEAPKASADANATDSSKDAKKDATKKASAGRKGTESKKDAAKKDAKAPAAKKATDAKKPAAADKAGVCGHGGGGALCIEATHTASIKVSASRFSRNAAHAGGAAFLNLDACTKGNETCATDVTTTEFVNNTAQAFGGALHLTDMAGVNLNCHPKHLTGAAAAANATASTKEDGKPAKGKGKASASKDKTGKGKAAAKGKAAKGDKGKATDKAAAKGKGKPAAPKPAADSPSASKKSSRKAASKGAKSTKPPKVAPPPSAAPSASSSPAKATSAKPTPAAPVSSPATAPPATPAPTAAPAAAAPIQCAQQLAAAQAPTVGPAGKGKCSNTFTANTVAAGYGPHVSTRVYCLEPRLLPPPTPLASALSPSGHVRVANDQTFSYSVTPFDYLLQHINVTLPDVAIASAPAPASKSRSSSASGPTSSKAAAAKAAAAIKVTSPLASIIQGEARLPNVSVTGHIGTHSIVLQARAGSRILASTPVFIDVRTCEVGEVTSGRTCRSCDDPSRLRTYSFNPLATKCARCPWHATCRGWALTPDAGYWHAHPRSARLHACPLPGACVYPTRTAALSTIAATLQPHALVPHGHTDLTRYERAQCAPGYRGPLCGSCAKGYGRLGQACKKCGSRVASGALLLLWKVVEAAIIAGLIALRVYSSHEYVRTRPSLLRAASAPNSPASSRASSPRSARARSRSRSPPASPTAAAASPTAPASPTANSEASTSFSSSSAEAAVPLLDTRTVAPALEDLLPLDPATGRPSLAALRSLNLATLKSFALAIASDSGHSVASVADALVLFYQLLALLATLPIALPAPLASLATLLTPRVPLDCLLAPASPSRAYARLTLAATTPALTLAILATTWWLVIRSRCPEAGRQRTLFLEAMVLTAFQFANFYYPQAISSLLSSLSCHSIACPWHALTALFRTPAPSLTPPPPFLGYWTQDFTATCFSRPHLSYALTTALPLLIILAATPPALLYSFIAHHSARGSLADPALSARFSYLFADYTPAMAQGHALKFAALFLLCALVQGPIYYLGSLLQLLLLAAAAAGAAWWLATAKPFVWKPLNGLYAMPLAATALVAVTAAVMGELPSGGVVGAVFSVLWLPALVACGLVLAVLAALVAAVAQPLLPKDKVVAAAQKLQGMVSGSKVKAE